MLSILRAVIIVLVVSRLCPGGIDSVPIHAAQLRISISTCNVRMPSEEVLSVEPERQCVTPIRSRLSLARN